MQAESVGVQAHNVHVTSYYIMITFTFPRRNCRDLAIPQYIGPPSKKGKVKNPTIALIQIWLNYVK